MTTVIPRDAAANKAVGASIPSSDEMHIWRFFRAGGFDQVRLDRGSDLLHLDELDQKLWVALACPVKGLEFDPKTLELIDTDKDGRIRVPEILAATRWVCSLLKNPDDLIDPQAGLQLSCINDDTAAGQSILASARQILRDLGRPDATAISLDDTQDTARIFAQTKLNGDGVVPADSAEDAATQAAIADIVSCLGGVSDRSGKMGVTLQKVQQFFAELKSYVAWLAAAETTPDHRPLGDKTEAAAAAVRAVKTKMDDYFARCRLAAFDPRALEALNRSELEYLEVAAKDMTISAEEVAGFPLASIAADRPLPLDNMVNPAWAERLQTLRHDALTPLLGDSDVLTRENWLALQAKLKPYETWRSAKPVTATEKLSPERAKALLEGSSQAAIEKLIAQDLELKPEADVIAQVDKLIRLHRDLHELLVNFVSFREFYGRRKAVFQAGTLFLDQRGCDLCVRVDDMARHGQMAHLSQTYLAYCDVVRKSTGEKMTIAAAFTAGDSDNLMVGRNGVFYDRQGMDWDATITKIVENPISIRQAFWLPYKRLVRWIEDQVAKRAAAADAAADKSLISATTAATQPATPGAPAAPKKIDIGVVAALGVAVSALATAAGLILQWISGTPWYFLPLYVVLIVLVISLPSMIIAALKLRQRNLGPILDANGWAVNARARINIPFGRSLTRVAVLPHGARRDFTDPYAETHAIRNWTIFIVVVLAALWATWFFGGIERAAPGVLPKSRWVLRHQAQRAKVEAAKEAAAQAATQTAPAAGAPATQPAPVAPVNP